MTSLRRDLDHPPMTADRMLAAASATSIAEAALASTAEASRAIMDSLAVTTREAVAASRTTERGTGGS
jgi:hypothetical protein